MSLSYKTRPINVVHKKIHVVLCVLGRVTLLRKIRVVLGLRCCLSLLGDLFMIDSLKLDDLLSFLC